MNPIAYVRGIFEMLPQSCRPLVIVGGGALRAYFDGTRVKDYDLFFRSALDYATTARTLVQNGWTELPAPNGTRIFRSPTGEYFNLIGFVFGPPLDHAERFDFRCCAMVAWVESETYFFHSADGAITDALARSLVVRNNNGTERTLRRINHYRHDYGYSVVLDDLPLSTDSGVPFDERVRGFIEALPRPQVAGGY